MDKDIKKEIFEEAEKALSEYNAQADFNGKHGYSEFSHSDYSDSDCCC